MKDIDYIIVELIGLYERERAAAELDGDSIRGEEVDLILESLDEVETRSDLIAFLSAHQGRALRPVEQVEALGRFLKEGFREEELNGAGIYLDNIPAELREQWDKGIFINTTPQRYHCSVDFDGHATFLGKWTIDVRQAHVKALAGVHANVRDALGYAYAPSLKSSSVRLPDTYYQKIEVFNELYDFSKLERQFQNEDVSAIFDSIKEQVGLTESLALLDTSATPVLKRGDQVIASDNQFVLVRNEFERHYYFFQKRSEAEVVQAINACQHHCVINDDLHKLKAALVRDEFLKQPDERIVLGTNQNGEVVSLKFDMDKFAFRPENLYEKGKFGRWTAFSNPIPLCIGYTLNAQLDSIKCHFEDCLKTGQKLGQTKQTGLKR